MLGSFIFMDEQVNAFYGRSDMDLFNPSDEFNRAKLLTIIDQ